MCLYIQFNTIIKKHHQSIINTIINLKNADLDIKDRLVKLGKLGDGYNEEMEEL